MVLISNSLKTGRQKIDTVCSNYRQQDDGQNNGRITHIRKIKINNNIYKRKKQQISIKRV